MWRIEFTSRSVEATAEVARRLASVLESGDALAITGDLGAGKTTFVRALAESLGVDPSVISSPTYVIANDYDASDGRGVVHIDAYRLSGSDELDSIGWDRVTESDAIVIIEWADRIETALADLPAARLARLECVQTGPTTRRLTLTLPDDWKARATSHELESRPAVTCPVTGDRVPGDSPSWPFSSERARLVDLGKWLDEGYSVPADDPIDDDQPEP